MNTNRFQCAAASLTLLVLSACGGSGSSAPAPTVIIGGSISGLAGSSIVVLENNGSDKLSVSANGNFAFAVPVAANGSYAVKINSHPVTQRCSITNGTGTNVQANVVNVTVVCVAAMESVLHNFTGTANDVGGTRGQLTLGGDGTLYGVTATGGASNNGTVIKLSATNVVTVLHSFAGGTTDGRTPEAALTPGADGNLYGVTMSGGATNNGTIFKITPSGIETVLHSFAGGTTDGASPRGSLKLASDGNFYGMTFEGGASGIGTVYKVTPAGVVTVLHSFTGAPTGGAYPTGSLNQGSDGNFYALTSGGAAGVGAVLKITPTGVTTVLYSFANDAVDGVVPRGTLVTGADGNFYGVTSGGGTSQSGTFFKITPAGVKTTLHSFAGPTDGLEPLGLVLGKDGNFYGAASGGGAKSNGTIFMTTPAGVLTILHAFDAYSTTKGGAMPLGVTFGADGYLYGLTSFGGTIGNGVVFRY